MNECLVKLDPGAWPDAWDVLAGSRRKWYQIQKDLVDNIGQQHGNKRYALNVTPPPKKKHKKTKKTTKKPQQTIGLLNSLA